MKSRYKTCYVAYFDILGFKNFVLESEKDEKKFNNIYELQQYLSSIRPDGVTKKNIYFLSDSFFAIIPLEKNPISSVIWEIADIQANIISRGYLIRGAITIGKVFYDDNNFFGPAINEVVELEKTIKNPMIVLSSHFIEDYILYMDKIIFAYDELKDEIKDAMDYLKYDEKYKWVSHINNQDLTIDREKVKSKLYELVSEGMKCNEERVRNKYMWINDIYFK